MDRLSLVVFSLILRSIALETDYDRGSPCRFEGQRSVVCDLRDYPMLNLSQVVRVIPKNSIVEDVTIRNGNFTSIKQSDLSEIKDVLQLTIEKSGIRYIERCAFCDLKELQHLDLSANKLKVLSDFGMAAGKVRWLSFASNQIEKIENGSFDGLIFLTNLTLYNNKLSELDSEVLQPLSNHLLYLDLGANLGRSHNILSHGLENGEYSDMFANFSSLNFLGLSNMQIQTLPDDQFLGLWSLKVLDLSKNSITHVDWLGLNHIKEMSLHLINLANNEISLLTLDNINMLASRIQPHGSLDLSGNPFQCTCSLRDFILWEKTDHQVSLIGGSEYRCHRLSEYSKEIYLLSHEALLEVQRLCDIHPITTGTIVIIIICGVLLIFLLSIVIYCTRQSISNRFIRYKLHRHSMKINREERRYLNTDNASFLDRLFSTYRRQVNRLGGTTIGLEPVGVGEENDFGATSDSAMYLYKPGRHDNNIIVQC